MSDYNIVLNDEEVEYLNHLDTDALIEDMVSVCNLIDSLHIDENEIVYE